MAHDQALAGNMVGTCVGIHLAHYCCMEGITLGKNSVVFLKITIPIGPPTPWISHHWLSPLLCFFYLKPPVFIFLLKSQAFLCINLEPGSQGDISHWFPSLKLFFPKPFNFPLSSLPVPSNTLFFSFPKLLSSSVCIPDFRDWILLLLNTLPKNPSFHWSHGSCFIQYCPLFLFFVCSFILR